MDIPQPELTILDTQLVQCTLFAFATLLVYDYLCTLDQELAYVWTSPSQWSFGTILFFLNRYLPFVDTYLSLKLKLSVNSPETCRNLFRVITWLLILGGMISELILLLRTYAIWERRRPILYILLISSALTGTSAVIVTMIELRSLKYIPTSLPGCHLQSASKIVIGAYIALTVSETTMAILIGIKAYRHLRSSQSRWVLQLYREGLLFYIYLLLISFANILVPMLAPRVFATWLATPQRVIHSVLTSRILLSILKQRNASNMTNRMPKRGEEGGEVPTFMSFLNEEVSTNMTYTHSEGQSVGVVSSTLEDAPPCGRLKPPDDFL